MPVAARFVVLYAVMGLFVAACASGDNAIASPTQKASPKVAAVESAAEPPRHQVKRFRVGKPYRQSGRLFKPKADWTYNEVGVASWYGGKFHGRKTANGEIFDKNLLTAAHKTLPLPVIAKVTNLSNGRSVKVRINDRGPFTRGRLIDLSQAAAQKLGFIRNGTAKVRVEVLPGESRALVKGSEPYQPAQAQLVSAVPVRERSAVYLQLGSFAERDNANRLKKQLEGFGNIAIKPVILSGKEFFRVRMGPFIDASAALIARERLAEAGLFRSRLVIEGSS